MIYSPAGIAETVAVLGTLAGMSYYVLCLSSATGFLREQNAAARRPLDPKTLPPVSILKPLKGTDPGMFDSLRSHCVQDYPEYEIVFGVSDPGDPAIALVEQLQVQFPALPIRLVVCPKNQGANRKVSSLAQMLPQARYEQLIVNDGDIRVAPDYLRRVVPPLLDPGIGLVTCLYRGVPGPSLGSRLESLGISTDFCAGVLVARRLERGLNFGLGSTLAFRRRDLATIGGFEALADYLADDYEIGRRIAALGLEVKLSETVVETFLPRYRWREFLSHQLRWARTVRHSRPGGYLGLVLTFAIPWVLIALAGAYRSVWAWELAGVALVLRIATALVVGRGVLRDPRVPSLLGLIPLRDCVALLIWFGGFMGHMITWRGDSFELKKGKLVRIRA
jgi:ceramide glucosyltransferase